MHLSPEEFVLMLIDKLNISAVCVGYDYRFGYKAEGDVKTLKKLGEKYGFRVIVTDEMKTSGVTIKSTKIRELVCEGKVDDASLFLGRPFSVTGEVTKGLRNGHKLGTPTANVCYGDNKLLPKEVRLLFDTLMFQSLNQFEFEVFLIVYQKLLESN